MRAATPAAGEATPLSPRKEPKRIAVFVSGGGSNLKALHAATLDGTINGSIAVRCPHPARQRRQHELL